MSEYDHTRTWSAKSLWKGTGKNRKPHPDAMEALAYIREHRIVRGTYGGAATHSTTLPNALRRHLPNVDGLTGKGTRKRIADWQASVRAINAPTVEATDAPGDPVMVNLSPEAFAAFEAWQASQAG